MTAPERIWIDAWGERIWIDAWGGNWSTVSGGTQRTEYIRADLTQTDPRDEVIKGLVEAATDAAEAIDMAYGSDDDESPHRHSAKLRAALAAAKAVQHD